MQVLYQTPTCKYHTIALLQEIYHALQVASEAPQRKDLTFAFLFVILSMLRLIYSYVL